MTERSGFDATEAAVELKRRTRCLPEWVVVAGSGLAGLANAVEQPVVVPFAELPGFPAGDVAGHDHVYVAGRIEGRDVLIQSGRFHSYDGYAPDVVVRPVRVAHALGARHLLLSNAAGGIQQDLAPGTLMLLRDHIDLTGCRVLVGSVLARDHRFADGSGPYSSDLQILALRAAADLGIALAEGVYAAVLGPCYETPAEIRMLARAGADAVGMSTVPEVVAARSMGMDCLAVSLITNLAAGRAREPLDHREVLAAGREATESLSRLLRRIIGGPRPAGTG